MTNEYPRLKEIFELEFDGDDPENTPLEMVRLFHCNPNGWDHNGEIMEGRQRHWFILVQINHSPDVFEAKKALEKVYGKMPEGQWLSAFIKKYPRHDGNGPVGIADPSWIDPGYFCNFPCVRSRGKPSFNYSGQNLSECWRWLVFAPASADFPLTHAQHQIAVFDTKTSLVA